ncbi:hypothetical protein [Kitasatospora sp. GP82]|uniref:hypothetical protein n=1 Tax=Kitasatospora sp. GP82 TaxID=3035089 RepID=UPI0024732BEF|nr:hypothetical protein [Kitasatospora sp. GP82]MDH6130056.1 hypothetical protein [Kitasatospora sp. GP82]
MTVELTARLDDALVARLQQEAEQAGIDLDTYLARVLTADHLAAQGTRAEQIARASAHTAAAYHSWNTAGRPEDGVLTFDDVFGQ